MTTPQPPTPTFHMTRQACPERRRALNALIAKYASNSTQPAPKARDEQRIETNEVPA